MLNFEELEIESKEVEKPKTEPKKGKIQFQQVVEIDKPKLSASDELAERKRLHQIEPGYKIPLSNYRQIAQWCHFCQDVTSFAGNPDKEVNRCLKCKKDWYYGSQRHRNPRIDD